MGRIIQGENVTAVMAPPLFTEREAAILAPAEVVPLPEWAERYRMITSGPAVPVGGGSVRWSNDLDPLGVSVMKAMDSPHWSRVIFMGSPQRTSKTELGNNKILSTIHQQAASVFYFNATAVGAGDVWNTKIKPAFLASPDLAKLLPPDRDDGGTRERRDFANGASLFIRGSESRAALAQATAMVIVGDDVQAMGKFPEGDHPVDVATERADSHPVSDTRVILLGQPGLIDDYLSIALFASAFFVPFVPCVRCGTYQMIEWSRMVYSTDPREARRDTWMRCAKPRCQHQIRDDDLPQMLAAHKWVSTPPGENWVTNPMEGGTTVDLATAAVYPATRRQTTACGFWRSAFYWPFVSYGALAVDAIEAEGSPDSKINFQKRIRAVPWEEPSADEDALKPADITAHAMDSHHYGTVPEAAGCHKGKGKDEGVVIVTADVQAGWIWYLVTAWNLATGSSWLIVAGRYGSKVGAQEFGSDTEKKSVWKSRVGKALEKLWTKESEGWSAIDPSGQVLATVYAKHCLIDCGFLRETVQDFCRLRNGGRWAGKWLPIEGSQCRAKGRVPAWPGIRKATIEKKTNRRYWECNTNRAKLWVRDILARPPGQPGSLVLPADMPAYIREEFAKQLCAEEWNADTGVWKKVAHANHLLDCQAEQVIGALACEVRLPFVGQEKPKPVDREWFKRQREKRDAR